MSVFKNKEIGKYMSLLMRVGSIMITSIILFFGAGLFLCEKFELPLILLIIFTLLGVATGFYLMIKEIKKRPKVSNLK